MRVTTAFARVNPEAAKTGGETSIRKGEIMTNRAVLFPLVLVCSLIPVLPSAQIPVAAGAKETVRHTVLATSGSAAPAGGNYVTLFRVALNARGQIAFDTSLGGPSTTGVFLTDGRTTSTIALGGNPDPTAANFAFVNNPFVTSRGDVVFDANFSGTFRADGNMAGPLVRNGDPAPGGGTLTPLSHATNRRGTIAYRALVSGAVATTGIFRTDGEQTVAIARDDGVAPTGGTFTFFADPAINTRGQVTFVAEMTGGAADFAILRGDGASLTPIFVANQIAPGGATFQDFSDPLINTHGQVAAVALLTNGPDAGLFVGDGRDAAAIALDGQPAPSGGSYSLCCAVPLTLNDRAEVAFHTGLTGGSSNRGIFRGNGQQTTVIALTGTNAPGTTGTFASFGDIKLGNDGRVGFIGTLTMGVGGVDLSNNMGIWVGRSEADLQLVVRTGQVIDGKVLTRLPTGLGQFEMNERGVVWIGSFPSRATSVVFSRIREDHADVDDRDSNDRQ